MRFAHWSKHHQHRKHWSMLVLVAKSEAGVYGVLRMPKARVVIERHGGKLLDHDNAVAGCKAIIDGLKDCGLIADDSPDHITLELEQHPGMRLARRTVVRISPA